MELYMSPRSRLSAAPDGKAGLCDKNRFSSGHGTTVSLLSFLFFHGIVVDPIVVQAPFVFTGTLACFLTRPLLRVCINGLKLPKLLQVRHEGAVDLVCVH